MKVVGFTIEIKGQKDILATTKILGLLNTQLILINGTLIELYKTSGTVGRQLSKQFKGTSSSVKKLGTVVKSSFQTFEKGNKVVQNMGNGFFEVTKQIDKTAKEFKELDKATEKDSKSIKDLIKRNKELKKVLQEQPINKTTKQLKELAKEYSKNNDAIKAFRKELRTGKKASDATEGSLDQLRKRAIDLKKAYNSLSKQQRRTFKGKQIQRQLLKTQKRIQKLDLAVRDGRTSIGLYGNALKGLNKKLVRAFVGRSIFSAAFQAVGRLASGLKTLAENSKEIGGVFDEMKESSVGFSQSLKTSGTRILGAFGSGISKVIDNVSFVIDRVSTSFVETSKSAGIMGKIMRGIGHLFREFPAIFGGFTASISAMVESSKAQFTIMSLDAENLSLTLQSAFAFGINKRIIIKRLKEIQKETKEAYGKIIVNTKQLAEAYNKGFEETKEAQRKFKEETLAAAIETEKQEKLAAAIEENKKKRAAAEEQRILDSFALRKEVDSNALARIKITLDLETKLRDLQIESIEETTEKALAEQKERFEQEIILRENNFNKIVKEAKEEQEKIKALFDEGTEEFIAIAEKREQALFEITIANNRIAEQKEKQHQETLLQILKDGDKAKLDAQKKAFEDVLIELEAEEEAELAAEGAKSDAIIGKQIEAAKEQQEVRKQTTQQVLNLVSTVFDSISKISQIAFEAENARFQQAIEIRKGNIENLNEDLQNATGLQKKFLEIQVKQEEEALAKETEAKKKAAKRQAEDQKAIAIVQAIIGGALAIVNAFTLPPPASFIAAAATALAVGVEIAAIASQKFAKGGILLGPSHSQGGIQTNFGELEGGEAVINKRSTRQFLPLLSEINFAGGGKRFAEGGILTSPISAPNVGNAQTDFNERFGQLLNVSIQQTQATNARIDRLQVNLDLNNLEDIQDNDANLDTLTTF